MNPETTGGKQTMGTSSHSLRLKRLEAYGAASKTEPLFFCLHEWADRTISQLAHDDPETIAREEAKALDRLFAAGKIQECDRHRVRFIVWVIWGLARYGAYRGFPFGLGTDAFVRPD